jgi:hypothetical protein
VVPQGDLRPLRQGADGQREPRAVAGSNARQHPPVGCAMTAAVGRTEVELGAARPWAAREIRVSYRHCEQPVFYRCRCGGIVTSRSASS